MNNKKRQIFTVLMLLLVILGCTGCGKISNNTEVVLTTGFAKDEVFRIETISCTLPEIMVYLTNTQNQYESVYGNTIWQTDLNGVTLEDNVKETVLAKIAQIKAMNLLAKSHGIILSEEELKLVDTAASEYYGSLNETEIKDMNITKDVIVNLYSEYALADKVYNDIIKDINPEISDDEARTITVEQILFKTYSLDSDGNRVVCTDVYKTQQYQKAQEVLTQLSAGTSFEDLMTTYSEDNTGTYSFGKGEMEATFEEAAFQLGNDEVSGIIENDEGYHIIKCISTFNREETDANKIKIVEQRKNEVFGEEYDTFVSTLKKNINQNLWDSVTFIHDEKVTTKTFFDVYDRYFQVS